MSDIFLSYKSEDRPRAKIIAEALEQHGYSVWRDRVIPPGRNFDEVIEEELDAAKCIVVLWSKKSVQSKWVKTEADEGDKRKILIPVMIEDVEPPLAFRMMEAAKLTDWDGTLPNCDFDLLVESIAGILGERYEPTKKESGGHIEKKEIAETSYIKLFAVALLLGLLLLGIYYRGNSESNGNIKPISPVMEFVLIPAGEFTMGSFDDLHNRPVHPVKIGKGFYMGKYEVTQKQWRDVMGSDPSFFREDNLPVDRVSWDDVQEFIRKINDKESTNKYRLPSEAEWEYVARSGTTTNYSFGDNESKLGEWAWYDQNSDGKTHSVGQKKPNPWGLYDVQGNVFEWVQDKWHDNYKEAPSDGSAWESGGAPSRVVRGGGWSHDAESCQSQSRYAFTSGDRISVIGFRLLRDL